MGRRSLRWGSSPPTDYGFDSVADNDDANPELDYVGDEDGSDASGDSEFQGLSLPELNSNLRNILSNIAGTWPDPIHDPIDMDDILRNALSNTVSHARGLMDERKLPEISWSIFVFLLINELAENYNQPSMNLGDLPDKAPVREPFVDFGAVKSVARMVDVERQLMRVVEFKEQEWVEMYGRG